MNHKHILNIVRDDSLFPNIKQTVYNKEQVLEAIEMACIEFGNKLWGYLPTGDNKGNRLFQNPETGDILTIEEIYNTED